MHRCGGAPRLLGSRNAPAARSRQAPGRRGGQSADAEAPSQPRTLAPDMEHLWSQASATDGPPVGTPGAIDLAGGAHPPAAAIAIGVPHPSASDSSVGVPVGVVARITR